MLKKTPKKLLASSKIPLFSYITIGRLFANFSEYGKKQSHAYNAMKKTQIGAAREGRDRPLYIRGQFQITKNEHRL